MAEPAQFDIIGDVHGCSAELFELLRMLESTTEQRMLVFVGDLVNRGPDPAGVLEKVMALCNAGRALCVLGNHDDQLRWSLRGRPVEQTPELVQTRIALDERNPEFRASV